MDIVNYQSELNHSKEYKSSQINRMLGIHYFLPSRPCRRLEDSASDEKPLRPSWEELCWCFLSLLTESSDLVSDFEIIVVRLSMEFLYTGLKRVIINSPRHAARWALTTIGRVRAVQQKHVSTGGGLGQIMSDSQGESNTEPRKFHERVKSNVRRNRRG